MRNLRIFLAEQKGNPIDFRVFELANWVKGVPAFIPSELRFTYNI